MTAFLPKHGIAYISVPKVACTSLKHFFYEQENGHAFQPFRANGKRFDIHRLFPGLTFEDVPKKQIANMERYAVVREPVARFLSCYSNRVVYHREITEALLGADRIKAGIVPHPDVHTYIKHFREYRKAVRNVRWHSRPLASSLGRNPDYYTRIFNISEINAFTDIVNQKTGTTIELGRHQTGGPKIPASELSAEEIAFIKDFYKKDYEIYGAYFGA
jgi:hypothetical protein